MSSTLTLPPNNKENHEYQRPPSGTSRAPCSALNTLANHGFIRREGTDLTFLEVLRAIVLVYNLSYPLAFILILAGFITCGKVSFDSRISSSIPPCDENSEARASFPRKLFFLVSVANSVLRLIPSFTLDLHSLSARGHRKLTHDAALVHPNVESSTAPDPTLLRDFLTYASTMKNADGSPKEGLGLVDLAMYHAKRCKSAAPLDSLHATIGLGECALTWEMLSTRSGQPNAACQEKASAELYGHQARSSSWGGLIPVSRLEQWFGEERLPDGWWGANGVRPIRAVGFLRTKRMANLIGELGK